MLKDMPAGQCIETTNPNLDDIFGFCLATIECPRIQEVYKYFGVKKLTELTEGQVDEFRRLYPEIYYPAIPTRKDGRLIMALEQKEPRWYFSEELKYIKSLGYKVTIIKSYHFERTILFKDYVEDTYKMKEEGDEVERKIAKLLLNSLYGRWGYTPENIQHKIIPSCDLIEYIQKYDLVSTDTLPSGKLDISYIKEPSIEDEDSGNYKTTVQSVGISSAIAAYGRIEMHKTLCDIGRDGGIPNYVDTDSVFVNIKLPKETLKFNKNR